MADLITVLRNKHSEMRSQGLCVAREVEACLPSLYLMLRFIGWASVQTITSIGCQHYHPKIKEAHTKAMSHVWSNWCITEHKHNPTVHHYIGAKGRRWVTLPNHTMPWDQPRDNLPCCVFWLADAVISVSSAQEVAVEAVMLCSWYIPWKENCHARTVYYSFLWRETHFP